MLVFQEKVDIFTPQLFNTRFRLGELKIEI